ncbi:Smr/MutS family protein [Pseudenhygromyxa sp. WMMC2535]|uniref:Smr/MutS family protein n=1 Tax=Pseudenhygromyxa sp. WMMC2535 TaxID=2712867 RepID=UPI001554595E|nr:Smr/MutS family protein [Pseudenhygromyxa sp. WMMC2535]NVB38731.1 Smr/MutS family protein [Pseudenhygromyxa sp. WMMC2535]
MAWSRARARVDELSGPRRAREGVNQARAIFGVASARGPSSAEAVLLMDLDARPGKGPRPGLAVAGRMKREKNPTGMAALLEPHADLFAAAREREASEALAAREAAAREAAARVRRLGEDELMALIFDHLDEDNPRVCEGVDFERLLIFVELPASPKDTRADEDEDEDEDARGVGVPAEVAVSEGEARALGSNLDPKAWVGSNWVDDIRPIPEIALEHPELDADQRTLLARAGRGRLPTCNLRHLRRVEALRQLEFFARVCRAQGERYCRVIPGKGVESRSQPVLKRMLLAWCSDPGQPVLGWAPELDVHGEWGSAIVELRVESG